MQDTDDSSLSHRRTAQLPPLAPRQTTPAAQDRSSNSSSRPPRLSHRSRQGCWTCRARKVKCDEVHPKCGPCTRLSRECDWDHRWNFSDATRSTREKYPNVRSDDNVVWDPGARSSSTSTDERFTYDDQAAFHLLSTDEERERKAETRRPGTYGVVVTPDSFAELPEYATSATSSRRMSLQSPMSGTGYSTPVYGRPAKRASTDPNVIVLDRFEDTPTSPAVSFLPPSLSGRGSNVQSDTRYLPMRSAPLPDGLSNSTHASRRRTDDELVQYFRRDVVSRLVQPHGGGVSPSTPPKGSTRDTFEAAARRFRPLHHAICAVSALKLALNGESTMEEALQHYHQALSTSTNASPPDDLASDGLFLRHFLLLIFDICFQIGNNDNGSTNAWTIHLDNLKRSAMLRHQRYGRETHAYLIWSICELDVYACLLGNGECDFIQTMMQHNMLPPLDQQLPIVRPDAYFSQDPSILQATLALRQAMFLHTAKLAQTAQLFRNEAAEMGAAPSQSIARWQTTVVGLQNELLSTWMQWCPPYLNSGDPRAGQDLPEQTRYVYEHALTLYHTSTIYSRTSMFPSQRRLPIANHVQIHTDTETRAYGLLTLASDQLDHPPAHPERRHTVFPLFMAGFASNQPDTKARALELLKRLEGGGIGQNTARTRVLLKAVCEEQRRRRAPEEVDWLALAKERSLNVVNCGL